MYGQNWRRSIIFCSLRSRNIHRERESNLVPEIFDTRYQFFYFCLIPALPLMCEREHSRARTALKSLDTPLDGIVAISTIMIVDIMNNNDKGSQ